MARVFTREEFYELVWSKPLTHLAKEFSISDVALHKICRKHDIPNPPLGWWAKAAAGKKVKQTPLPPGKPGITEAITIAANDLTRQSTSVAAVREQARVTASAGIAEPLEPQPLVIATVSKLKKAKLSEKGLAAIDGAGVIKCEVGPESIDRLANLLPKIIQAASMQGFEINAKEAVGRFEAADGTVTFSIAEAVNREPHILTPAEIAQQEAWKKKLEIARRRPGWNEWLAPGAPKVPEWDYHPSGQLTFALEHVYVWGDRFAPRRTFRDTKNQRLENMVGDIAVALKVLAAVKTEERLKREAEERRRAGEERRRVAAARAKHIEERRTKGLGDILNEMAELERLKNLIGKLIAQAPTEPTPRVETMLSWAQEYLKLREERLSATALEGRFVAEKLFGDTDDHGFYPSRW